MNPDQLALALEPGQVPAVTVWQPWATAIFTMGKDVENRGWSTPYRGPLVIHAGRTFDHNAAAMIAGGEADYPHRGVLLGVVRLVDCTRDYPSRWAAAGQWQWVLADPRPLLVPIPMRGQRGLWPVSTGILEGRTG